MIFCRPVFARTTRLKSLLKLCREELLHESCVAKHELNQVLEKEDLTKRIGEEAKKSNRLYVRVKTCLFGFFMGMSAIGSLVIICQYFCAQNRVDDVEYQQNNFTQMRHMSRRRSSVMSHGHSRLSRNSSNEYSIGSRISI